jgi:hypothetical protein
MVLIVVDFPASHHRVNSHSVPVTGFWPKWRGDAQKHSPSIATLRKYAEAVGCRLEIRMTHI